jgi:predicted alpha/beta-fold hydrolase
MSIGAHAHFIPPRFLRNAHLQSIIASFKWRRFLVSRRARAMLTQSREHVLECGDDVRLMGFHSAHPAMPGDAPRPLVVLLHGWEGSAESLYLLSLSGFLYDQGYDIFRLNFRDHGATHHLNREIFHSCRIVEVVGAVRAIQDKFSPTRMSIAGFSLGGNFALRVAARAPEAGIRLERAIGICPVLSPSRTLAALEKGWFVYEQYFIRKWKNSLRRKQQCFPQHFDFKKILQLKSLNDMTDVLVREHSEYPDMPTYLEGYSILGDRLANLQVDSHIVLAADDPIIPARDAEELAKSPYLHVDIVPHGGHCGFVDNFSRESWADRTIARLLSPANKLKQE